MRITAEHRDVMYSRQESEANKADRGRLQHQNPHKIEKLFRWERTTRDQPVQLSTQSRVSLKGSALKAYSI